jgi:pilus assembly protein Flp/PilA
LPANYTSPIEGEPPRATVGAGKPESLMKSLVFSFGCNESGATAIEYALIAGLISVVIVGALTTVGSKVSAKFNQVATQLQ